MSKDTDQELTGVQLDVYGVKVNVQPRGTSESDPGSWAEVWQRVHCDLRGSVANLFGLVNDTLRSARSLVVGIGGLPGAAARRIESAHELADSAEERRQVSVDQSASALGEPLEIIQKLLTKKRVQGFAAKILSDGERVVIVALPPSEEPEIDRLGSEAMEIMRELPPIEKK